ncbi:MAG: hypothetical protein RIM72_18175, partial [Alphaproteobacteria bacterium]
MSLMSEAKLSVDDCHLVMLPVWPLSVKVVLFVPLHTVAPPEILPPTDPGPTVTVAVLLFAELQDPLVTTAR